jgi:hypothetical protein
MEAEAECQVFTRTALNVREKLKCGIYGELTRAITPATDRPRAETPFIEAAPVA